MNSQERTNDTRTFRIAVIAVAAAAVLVLAAYLFGTGLRADTSASADKGAALAALGKSRADFYSDLNNSAAAGPALSHYTGLRSLTLAEAAKLGLGSMVPAPAVAPAHYTGLRSLTLAEAAKLGLGNIAPAADPYQNEWTGITAPESVSARMSAAEYAAKFGVPAASVSMPDTVGARSSVDPGSAADQYPWMKPQGIRPATASGADQLQGIEPQGIKASGTK